MLLRLFDEASLRSMKDAWGSEGLARLAGKDTAFLDAVSRAWNATSGDSVARSEVMETLRLNNKGSMSNDAVVKTIDAYVRFKNEFGNRVKGDFISRFRRLFSQDTLQAEAELRLARDLLEGDSPLGDVSGVEGLPESTVPGEKVPEYRASTPDGARLVECKAIGDEKVPLSKNTVQRNVSAANRQIRSQAARTGEQGGLIRLDATKAANTDVSPETMVDWVSGKIPSPRDSTVVDWVEILYTDGSGHRIKLILHREGTTFVGIAEGAW